MAESTPIAELMVTLGVTASPSALPTLEQFDALIRRATPAVRAFAKVAESGAASFVALGASGAALSPLMTQIDALLERMQAVKAAGPVSVKATSGAASSTARADEAAMKAAAKAADQEAAAVEKARAKLETIGASANAVDKATLAFQREREAILQAAAATGDDAAAMKALTASEEKQAATLAKIARQEEAAAEKAAKLAEAQQKAARESESGGLFSASNVEAFSGALEFGIGIIKKVGAAAVYAAASVAALTGALAANSLSVAQQGLAAERAADATGLSVEEYQRAAYAFERYGVAAEKIPEVLGKLATKATDAANGSKDAAAVFKQLGTTSAAYLKLKPEQQLAALADGFQKITDPSERAALASKLLGDEMAKTLVPLLVQGSAGMDTLEDKAQSLGLVLSQDDVEASRKLTSAWAELTGMADGFRIRLGAALIPTLTTLADRLIGWYDANKQVIDQRMAQAVDGITLAFTALGNAATSVDNIFGGAGGFFTLVDETAQLAKNLWAVGKYVTAFALAANPVNDILIGLVNVGLAIQDLYIYMTGGTSVIGTLIDQFGQTDTLLGSLIRLFQALGNAASAGFNLTSIAFNAAWAAAAPFRDLLSEIADLAGGALLSAIGVLVDQLTTFVNLLTMAVNGLASLAGSPIATGAAQAYGAGIGGAASTLAPSAASPLLSLAPPTPTATTAARGSTSVQITVGGAQISGLGATPEQVQVMLDRYTDNQNRQIQQSLLGLSV